MVQLLDPPGAGTATAARPGLTGLDQETIRAFLAGDLPASAIPTPVWGPIGEEVFHRTYSRQMADGGQETWADTVRRVVLGNIGYAPDAALPDEAVELFDLIYSFSAIPAGRHLWVTGTPVSQLSKNCWVSGWSARTSDHFRFLASRLFEGGGVGANYSFDLRAVTAPVVTEVDVRFACTAGHDDYLDVIRAAGALIGRPADPTGSTYIAVPDSREGWVDAWCQVIDASTAPGETPHFVFDVSAIRPHGAPLRRFGGTASGPAPFVTATRNIAALLSAVATEGRQLGGLETMQIDHEIAAAVVAGGARRSARMSLMHWRDPEVDAFIACKADHMHHWSTNISVEIDDEFTEALAAGNARARAILDDVAAGMVDNGEPGLVNTSLHSIGEPAPIRHTNPCSETSLTADTSADGDAAGESCNLGSVNLEAFGSDIGGAAHAAALMARFLYRATLNPHPDAAASRIEAQNRRIGVGIMGLQGWAAAQGRKLTDIPGDPELREQLTQLRWAARQAADELADALGTPRSVKVTAVAPTGTIAQMAGVTPGIHPVFAKRFIRRVRYVETDPELDIMHARGLPIEPDLYAAKTSVVSFPVQDAIVTRYDEGLIEEVADVSPAQFLAVIAAVQETFCGGEDGQAVSATATIPQGTDPAIVAAAIEAYLPTLKGVTMFPDESRPQSPYERLDMEAYLAMASAVAGGADVGDSSSGECAGGACPIR